MAQYQGHSNQGQANQPKTNTYQRTNAPTHGSNTATKGNMGAQTTEKVYKEPLYKTGLFKSNREGVRSMASVQVKKEITIPAGSYINLYSVDDKSNFQDPSKAPDFSIQITEGTLKQV